MGKQGSLECDLVIGRKQVQVTRKPLPPQRVWLSLALLPLSLDIFIFNNSLITAIFFSPAVAKDGGVTVVNISPYTAKNTADLS